MGEPLTWGFDAQGKAVFDVCSVSTLPLEEKVQLLSAAGGRQMEATTLMVASKMDAYNADAGGIAVSKPKRQAVAFDESVATDSMSNSSRSSRPRSILRKARIDAISPSHDGPAHASEFAASGQYLTECSLSILEDLLSSWNFHVKGCCAWHASLKHMEGMLRVMQTLRSCQDKWEPDVSWQCLTCTALSGSNMPADACWLCCEPNPNAGDSASDGTSSLAASKTFSVERV